VAIRFFKYFKYNYSRVVVTVVLATVTQFIQCRQPSWQPWTIAIAWQRWRSPRVFTLAERQQITARLKAVALLVELLIRTERRQLLISLAVHNDLYMT